MAYGVERFKNLHLAFGHQQARVVQCVGGRIAQICEGKEIIFAEARAVGLVYDFHDADERAAIHDRPCQQGLHQGLSGCLVARLEARVRRVRNVNALSIVRNNARNSFVRPENLPLKGGVIFAALVQQLEGFIRMQEPDVYGFGSQDFQELGANERQ